MANFHANLYDLAGPVGVGAGSPGRTNLTDAHAPLWDELELELVRRYTVNLVEQPPSLPSGRALRRWRQLARTDNLPTGTT